MSIRVWGTSLLMFLSTVTAVGQTANRYLKAPLPQDWEESGEVFQQILPVDDRCHGNQPYSCRPCQSLDRTQ